MRAGRSMLAAGHHGTPLVVRASRPRTFLSLGIFAEARLVFVGVYLSSEALKRPLEAQQATVISAGVLLSLAMKLLFYVVRPKRFEALAGKDDLRGKDRPPESPLDSIEGIGAGMSESRRVAGRRG